jgi:hypothetical protein
MSWESEREALIARTMAFVQSVGGKKASVIPAVRFDAARPHVDIAPTAPPPPLRMAEPPFTEPPFTEPPFTEPPFTELRIAEPPFTGPRMAELRITPAPVESPPAVIQLSRPKIPSEFQREIHDRIESFRKHQERFNRERAEYFNATLARLRAALDEAAAQRIVK